MLAFKDILVIGLLLNVVMLCKPKKILFETIKGVHSYVVDGVNCDTVSYLVYNSPHSQKRGCGPNLSITVL